MTEYEFFMVFELDDSGDRVQLEMEEEQLQEILHPEQVFVIVKEPVRRIFIWKGAKSPVRKRFISSRVASSLQEELIKEAAFHRCKIVSVDQGDEVVEFLRTFRLESMEVTEKMEDLRYTRNIEKEAPEKFGGVIGKKKAQKAAQEEEYYSPALAELEEEGADIDVKSLGVKSTQKPKTTPKPKASPKAKAAPKRKVTPVEANEEPAVPDNYIKNILDKVLENKLPDNYKRQNLVVGYSLYGISTKTTNVLGKEVEESEWEPVHKLPKGIVELDDSKLRIYINSEMNTVEAIEILTSAGGEGKKKTISKSSSSKTKDISSMTVKDLKTYCHDHDIELPPNAKKAAIVKLIEAGQSDKPKSTRRQLPKIPSTDD